MYLTCEICGKSHSARTKEREAFNNNVMCDSCYKSYIKYPFHHIPPSGEIHYDDEGRMLCHICGRGFHKLTSHIKNAHNITKDEYKEMFGINRSFRLTSEQFKETHRSKECLDNLTMGRTNIKDFGFKNKGISRREQYYKTIANLKRNKEKAE